MVFLLVAFVECIFANEQRAYFCINALVGNNL